MVVSPFFRRPRGFGLLEVILVFALVIGASAITFSVFSPANSSSRVAESATHLNLIRGNVMSAFPLNRYTNLDTTTAVKGRLVPAALVNGQFDGSVVPHNVWGGDVSVQATTDGQGFVVGFTGVDPADCPRFAGQTLTQFAQVTINETPVTSMTDVATACAAATTLAMQFTQATVIQTASTAPGGDSGSGGPTMGGGPVATAPGLDGTPISVPPPDDLSVSM